MKTLLFAAVVGLFSLLTPRTVYAAEIVSDVEASPAGGKTVTLAVTAKGTQPFTYLWEKSPLPAESAPLSFVEIPGATGDKLILPAVTAAESGVYRVRVTNSAGSTLSPNAFVRVVFLPEIESYGVTVSGE